MTNRPALRTLLACLAVATAFALIATEVDARAGRGGGIGSRGARTYTAPPVTQTAPNTAAPINRSVTQPQRPAVAGQTTPAGGGLFNRPGFAGGLLAGFLGAGLLGLLFGQGLFGSLGGLSSFLGLLLQVVLIVVVARLLIGWWQRRNSYATAGGPSLREMGGRPDDRGHVGSAGIATGTYGGNVAIAAEDFDRFERRLEEIQTAYAAEDLSALRSLVTPEMLSYFAEELADNASRGVVNQLTDVKLLQGDLAEAWRESSTEYATVAMRYQIVDATIDRKTGALREGSREPQEVTELWTFMRSAGGDWILAAIQQA